MIYLIAKTALTASVIVAVSALAKRFSAIAAILAALPLTSILAMIWLYTETGDAQKISRLSKDIFWMVLPTLAFFLILPLLLKWKLRFPIAMIVAAASMTCIYLVYVAILKRFGITV